MSLSQKADQLQEVQGLEKLGCCGIEAIRCDEDERQIVTKDMIVGVHLKFYPAWVDFWNQLEYAT